MSDRPHQRSANLSSSSGSGSRDANAREAATIVAVAPTLEARSQLSPSLRAESIDDIRVPFQDPAAAPADWAVGRPPPATTPPLPKGTFCYAAVTTRHMQVTPFPHD